MNHIFLKKRSKKSGMEPGSLIHIGECRVEKTHLHVIDFNAESVRESSPKGPAECGSAVSPASTRWIEVEGVSDLPVLEELGQVFHLHPLVMEDIANTDQRPKVEEFGDYLYMALKMLYVHPERGNIMADQISIIVGKQYVISLQEGDVDVFDPLRARLREGKGRIRSQGADYLAYSMLDAVVDQFFVILEKFGDELDTLQDDMMAGPAPYHLKKIHQLKRDTLYIRRAVWPLRELVASLERTDSDLVTEPTKIYLKDVYDHIIYVIDTVETFREMLSGMLDIYLSSVSNRMNEVMKVLTVIATIFMPLTFIAGVYGMNFEYMPELKWHLGYPFALTLMTIVAVVMLLFFRRKNWL